MKVKFLAAPLIVGALMAPAAFSGATAYAAPVAPIVAVSATQPNKTLSVAEAQKELQVVNARIASLLDTQKSAKEAFAPANVLNIIGKLLETARRIKEALVNIIKGGVAFLKSIPTRVELLVTMVDTVNGAAHTLQDKAQPAHSHVFLELVHASVLLVTVSATSDQLKDEMAAVKKALAEAQKMPDLKPNDVATFYTKTKLSRVLRQIRFDRNTCVLPFKRLGTIYFMSRALLKATGVLMEPLVRVSEVDQAITDVKAAYQDALKAPNRLLTPAVPSVCLPAPAAS